MNRSARTLMLAAGVISAGVAAGYAMNRTAQEPAVPAAKPQEPVKPVTDDGAVKPVNGESGKATDDAKAAEAVKPAVKVRGPEVRDPESNRRIRDNPEPTVLSFKSASVSELIPMIVEYTGKVVLPQDEILSRRITVVNDRPLNDQQALDLVFLALQQKGVAVVEGPEIIYLRDQAQVDQQSIPVLGPDESVLKRGDYGTVVQKVFGFEYAIASNMGEIVKTSLPDYAKMTVDNESNQLVVSGPVAMLQRIEKLVKSLDKKSVATLATETFQLKFADAEQIAANIRELFGDGARTTGGAAAGGGGGGNQGGAINFRGFGIPTPQGGGQPGGAQQGGGQGGAGRATQTTPTFRVSSNKPQNAVTVLADPLVIDRIKKQITEFWDKPAPIDRTQPKVFTLKYIDPIKARDILEASFSTSSTRQAASANIGALAGQFTFTALPEASQIIVVAKSPDSMAVIEKMIEDIDKPRLAGMPRVVPLKHSQAEELADQLNALLAQDGTLAQIRRTVSELSDKGSIQSPFSQSGVDEQGNFSQQSGTTPDVMNFWWGRGRTPTDNIGTSTLVAKVRIVPVSRQNAVMVMAPPEYADAVADLINQLDKPGRQVLITAVIAEIAAEDALALGLRTNQNGITPTFGENNFAIGANTSGAGNANNTQAFTGTKNDILPGLFDTSVLNVGVNINMLLQALALKSSVSILSEPRVYTGDNQEAEFFSGQDIPFITESQPNNNGNLLQSFDYRAVGISLRVRPRITPQRDVDIKINLELSSTVPGQTLFGGAIVDRRETTTQLIVQDGQTVILSGIMRTQDSKTTRKVPLLGDLPFIGPLFTSVENNRKNTELIAFVTPIVIENPAENDAANAPYRQRLGELRDKLGQDETGSNWPPTYPPPAKAPASPTGPAAAAPAKSDK